ncbi:MAG: CsgG/HfaB family protein [Planctomycetota bacterium]
MRALPFVLVLMLGAGCATGPDDAHLYDKPLVAVIAFENRAIIPPNYGVDWQVGGGVAEILEDRLYQTGLYRVLDRADLDEVLREQDLQQSGRTRVEETVAPNRLKNAHYLVRGVITEFSHVDVAGWDFGIGFFRIGAGGEHAIVNIALKVTEVESGEVIYTNVIEGKVYAGSVDYGQIYKHVALGGHQFHQTPLGRALGEALDEAIDGLRSRIGKKLWRPRIAEIDDERIVLSGGADRKLRAGSRWRVRGHGKKIVDPGSGDVLGFEPGLEVGVLEIENVQDRYSTARIVSGQGFARGQWLERIPPPPPEPSSGEPATN